ncbi:MAG: arginine--tRNA ligase [Saprospiraceae bacterium]|nr:arginine--tRNA ligase [Saprospiraceae bacterium]
MTSTALHITTIIQEHIIKAVQELYGEIIPDTQVQISATRKEFEGDYTIVTFPFTKIAKKKPEEIGEELGSYLVANVAEVKAFNVIKGFLNLVVSDGFWTSFLEQIYDNPNHGQHSPSGEKVMVEFSSPNTNKPLHLGHIRNNLLGWSCSKILEAAGYEVVRVQVVNDRGIAICKSMLAWQKFGNDATPESTGIKSDHFVGDYYVLFEQKFQEEYKVWQQTEVAKTLFEQRKKKELDEKEFYKEFKNTYFNEYSKLGSSAREMLLKWEAGDEATIALWQKMNGWVYHGFEETYKKLGVSFDKYYYESDTYLLGKDIIQNGLDKSIFYKKDDGSVWVDLTDAKLDHKILLRSDGTSVYITQDLGTAQLRYKDFGANRMIYVVADEQNYHFQVLFEILKRLEEPYAEGLYHLAYGMVDLPTGKMKSREGTVVDADDLIAEVIAEARENSKERDTLADISKEEQEDILRKIGLAALKFFIIKVHPKKRMIFDPKESVDLQGQTGPYVQNAYVRIRSVLRKAESSFAEATAGEGNGQLSIGRKSLEYNHLETDEKDLIAQLYEFPNLILEAAREYDPSVIANYSYNLAKSYHKFYHDFSILKAESEAAIAFRLKLCQAIANTLRFGMDLLGIEMPERM